jgi:hypothetical protein
MIIPHGRFPRIGWIDGEAFTFLDNPYKLIDRARDCPLDIFTFLQNPESPAVFPQYRYDTDTFAALDLAGGFNHWWKEQCKYSVRKQVNKAEREGVMIRETPLTPELLEAVHQIYNETPIRQGRKFPYYGINPDQVRAKTETFPQRSIFLEARLAGKIIGFAKMVTFGRTYPAYSFVGIGTPQIPNQRLDC